MTLDRHLKKKLFTHHDVVVCLLLFFVISAIYLQTRHFEFVSFDDTIYVTENRRVNTGLTKENLVRAFRFSQKGDDTYYHPLTMLSHMIDCEVFGLSHGAHHLSNLLIHLFNTLLLFSVLRVMTGQRRQSAFVAFLFAVHPLNVDTVAWISERKNLLSTFFWLLTLSAYFFFIKKKNISRYVLIVCCMLLGLMAKPILVTIPFVMILLDFWPLGRVRYRGHQPDDMYRKDTSLFSGPTTGSGHCITFQFFRENIHLLVEKIPFFFLSALWISISSISNRHLKLFISTEVVPMDLRIANALISYLKYLWKMIWPFDLAFFYPYPSEMPPALQVIGSAVFLCLASFLILRKWNTKPWLTTGWLWYMGTLVPVIGIVQNGLWPSIADRWTYVPLVGIYMLIAWGISDILANWRYKTFGIWIIASVFLMILSGIAFRQTGYWKDSKTLFGHALEVTDNNAVAHNNLGSIFGKEGRLTKAREHFIKATQMNSRYVSAIHNLGLVAFREGDLDEAMSRYAEALRIDPDYGKAHYDMGVVLQKKGRGEEAGTHYLEALRIYPENAEAHINLGILLAEDRKWTAAADHFLAALKIEKNMPRAYLNLGNILFSIHKTEMAIANYRKAVEVDPNYAAGYIGLGNAFNKKGDIRQAEANFQKALAIDPNNAEAIDRLGKLMNSKSPGGNSKNNGSVVTK